MLKKLKSLFIVEDENDTKSSAKPGDKTDPEKDIPETSSPEVPSDHLVDVDLDNPNELSGKPDPKFLDVLLKAIEKNNLDGFDYLEYKQSLQSLNNMEMDEETKYKSAFAMAKTMGASSPKLIESANHYLGVLKAEEKKFKEALVNQREKQIKGREASLKKMEDSIVQKEAQIKKLEAEIKANKEKLNQIRTEINQSAAKVESTNDKFHLALQVVQSQIIQDVDKMRKYLK